MIDLYLRADTEAEMIAALPWAREDGEWITAGDGWALDLIGPVVTSPGEYDDATGEEIEPPVVDGRYHANLRCHSAELAAAVPAGIILDPAPERPARVWA